MIKTITTVQDIVNVFEAVAPAALQESYDNSGLLVGEPNTAVTGVLLCLDSTEAVVDEAIKKGYNVIIAHHPIIFTGLKRFTGADYVQRTVIKALRNNICIYACHTNLDNVAHGVNKKIGEKLGIAEPKILAPKKGLLKKMVVFVPEENVEEVKQGAFTAGAGKMDAYSECSFSSLGVGQFKPEANANPYIGSAGGLRESVKEVRLEFIFPSWAQGKVVSGVLKAHPYESVAYDVFALENKHPMVGSGMIANLDTAITLLEFLEKVKKNLQVPALKYTGNPDKKVKKIAWCGGSGSFLIETAKHSGADVFLSSDIKYHQFFDGEDSLSIVDIGHFEAEQFTIEIFKDILSEKFSTFAVDFAESITNPVKYL
ncbi:MAG: Nif3-like dinuclear metal center hexameric protein [Luteibaculaceae bacterium]